jgi:hypothetical protein
MYKLIITMVVIGNGAPAISTTVVDMASEAACKTMERTIDQNEFHRQNVGGHEIWTRSMSRCFADEQDRRVAFPPFPFPFRAPGQ